MKGVKWLQGFGWVVEGLMEEVGSGAGRQAEYRLKYLL